MGLLGVTFWKCFETQHLLAVHFGMCSGEFSGVLYPIESGMETLKDRVLLVDKFFFSKENILFCIL